MPWSLEGRLKVMIHLGSHPNIVNVLGACTTKLPKQELYVVVEYCEHGDIADVLRKHKQAFRRKTLQMQRAESRARPSSKQRTTSSSSSIFNESLEEAMFENKSIGRMDVLMESTAVHYRPMHGSSGRQRTDTIREKIALTMSKLISWSEQIAHGMDYLSSKRVIHGDLACRNILLARNNVVKISDFGLSKYVEYKNYYKHEKAKPLPIKWLSLETLRDGVYTCQSDVWSYAVVLWEIFSLGDTPYPGVDLNDVHHAVTREGLRLSRPELAFDCIFQVMQKCQSEDPSLRPTFSRLTESFQKIANDYKNGGLFLEPLPAEPPQPRSAFANNSLYFSSSESESTTFLPTQQGADGYLLPSPTTSVSTFKPKSQAYLQV